jgi:hypothetical protein
MTTVHGLSFRWGTGFDDGARRRYFRSPGGKILIFAGELTGVVFVVNATGETTVHGRVGSSSRGIPRLKKVIGGNGLRVSTANLVDLSSGTRDPDGGSDTGQGVEGNSGKK